MYGAHRPVTPRVPHSSNRAGYEVERALEWYNIEGLGLSRKEAEKVKAKLLEESGRSIESARDPAVEAFKAVTAEILSMLEEKLERTRKHYEKIVAEGVPRSGRIEDSLRRISSRINEVKETVSSSGGLQRTSSMNTIVRTVVDIHSSIRLTENIVNLLEEMKESVTKIVKGEKITWREADVLSVMYDFSIISPHVYPKSIRVPPVKALKGYVEKLSRYNWKPKYMGVTRNTIFLGDEELLIGMVLDKEINLPDDVKGLNIHFDEFREDIIDRVTSEGLEIVVASDGFRVKGVESSASVLLYFKDNAFVRPVTVSGVKELGSEYSVLKYTRETGRILAKLTSRIEVKLTSTGGIVAECFDKCYIVPGRNLGLETVENKMSKIAVVPVPGEVMRLLARLMKLSSTGNLILVNRDGWPAVNLGFTDKKGVKVFASAASGITESIDPSSIEEVKLVRVKPKPYLKTFINKHIYPYIDEYNSPVLLTHDGHLMVVAHDGFIYLTPEKSEIDKPVKVNSSLFYSLYDLVDTGLIPVDPSTSEESVRLGETATRIYELLKKAEPSETYEIEKLSRLYNWGELPDYVEYVVSELNLLLGVRGRVKINVYEHEEGGVFIRVVEAIVKENVKILHVTGNIWEQYGTGTP